MSHGLRARWWHRPEGREELVHVGVRGVGGQVLHVDHVLLGNRLVAQEPGFPDRAVNCIECVPTALPSATAIWLTHVGLPLATLARRIGESSNYRFFQSR